MQESLKNELTTYLKRHYKSITSVGDMWSHAKEFYKNKQLELGGGYASFGTSINVWLYINNEALRFKVELNDIICNK